MLKPIPIHILLIIAIALLDLLLMVQPVQASRVVKFYDGDNMTVIQGGIKTKVSLACIDAPELKQAFGQSARKSLKAMVGNSDFSLRVLAKDRFGRLVAEVFAHDLNVNKALIEKGLAHFYSSYKNGCEGYAEAERQAQIGRLGMWRNGTDIELPNQFRKTNY
ncbi:MAG: thermonuclease family protein [Pseudanabaena sp. RU_4_16]|nr:thermonuclease family protein [Pseudanabaena sp. RU_4_16]